MFLRTRNRKWREADKNFKNADPYKKWKPVHESRRSFFVYCGKVAESTKEDEIDRILTDLRVRFYREISFDLKSRFDFYIPWIDAVIEYDGRHHFEIKQFDVDKKKDELCHKIGVRVIRYNRNHNLLQSIKADLLK